MAKLVNEMGIGPMGMENGATMHITAVINAQQDNVYILFLCDNVDGIGAFDIEMPSFWYRIVYSSVTLLFLIVNNII